MELQFQLSKKDHFTAAKLYLKNFLQRQQWVFIVFTIFLIFSFSGESTAWWRVLIALTVSPLIAIAILYGIPLAFLSIRLNKALKKDVSLFERKSVSVSDEGLVIASDSKTQTRIWESMVSAYSNEKFIYIVLADKKYIPFPKSAFSSDADAVNFLGIIQNKIIHYRGPYAVTMYAERKKPHYAMCLLCLIPLVGAVAGLVFIINGITQYKDKWLIIFGVAGILWSVGIYGSMFYSMSTPSFKKAFIPQSQKQLNSVMKAVEFYKVKNGVYPDSLKQINDDNSETWIFDPISGNKNFNYQKVGNHYYLFSSGLDGIPNTKDDIYPQLTLADSGKFGLLIKRY